MPEWASVLVGLGVGVVTGVVATAVGVYYGEWLRDRRARRKQGAELVARVRVLLEDADPAGFALGTMQERNQRHGQSLWRRWRELREPFLEFGLLSSAEVRDASKKAATEVALTIQALRNSLDDAFGSATAAQMRRTAGQLREQAGESLDRLEEALD